MHIYVLLFHWRVKPGGCGCEGEEKEGDGGGKVSEKVCYHLPSLRLGNFLDLSSESISSPIFHGSLWENE